MNEELDEPLKATVDPDPLVAVRVGHGVPNLKSVRVVVAGEVSVKKQTQTLLTTIVRL